MKKQISFSLDEEVVEKLTLWAENENRTLSNALNIILNKYFKLK